MGVALGLIAIALAGAAGEPKSGGEKVQIQYTVSFIETEGMGWREAVFTRLTPVTRQGAATVWTAPANVKPRLLQRAIKDRRARPVQTTAIKAWSGSPAHFLIRDTRSLVTQVAWDGNDRPEEGKPETVRTGPVGTMSGRKMDQGVLVQLVLEDTEVRAVHHVSLPRPGELTSQAPTVTATQVQAQVFIGQGKAAGLTAFAYEIPPPLPLVSEESPFLAIPVTDETRPEGVVSEIRFEGNTTIPAEKIKAKLLSRIDQPIDPAKIKADIKVLFQSGWFADVSASFARFPGKHILYFTVHEKPANRVSDVINQGIGTAKATAPSDCACEKDGVIQAHLETMTPASSCCTTATSAKTEELSTVSIEVPEIASQEIAGEWLIPKDGILLVSFGPHTVADQDGKAVIRERLAILEAAGAEDGAVRQSRAAWGRVSSPVPMAPEAAAVPRAIPAPIGPGNAPASFPALPSRSMPQGIHADGTPAALPQLPADEPDPDDASSTDSAEPRPSPQTRKPHPSPSKPVPVPDPQMKRTSYSSSSILSAMPQVFLAANPTVGLQFIMPIKAVAFRLPFNRKLEIEIFGRITRNPDQPQAPAELVVKPQTSATR
ncbi:MAG: POTRA domain-containing protein [Isosphaeraceae bacterium]